jgi:hypothetical protein
VALVLRLRRIPGVPLSAPNELRDWNYLLLAILYLPLSRNVSCLELFCPWQLFIFLCQVMFLLKQAIFLYGMFLLKQLVFLSSVEEGFF